MEQALQIKRASKPPCKNDRKTYLQKVILTRMGSFNSAPRINNIDSQDDNLELPKGLNAMELLRYLQQLRGENPEPLLKRDFLKPTTFERNLFPIKFKMQHKQELTSSGSAQLATSSSLDDDDDAAVDDDDDDLTDGLRSLDLNTMSQQLAKREDNNENQIRIFQWNILSQTLGQNNDGFVRCPEKALTWEHRKYLIVQEILQTNPDVICLQEVDHFKFLEKVLGTLEYAGIFFPKPDSPCLYIEENNGPDGCAIFYKSNKFELKEFQTRILEVWRVQSNQVAIAALLQIRETGREFCVCTTHLKARRGSLLAKLRNEQGRDLIRFVKNFAGTHPLLLCGDFNAEPIEPIYATILNCDFFKLSSAYADMKNDNRKMSFDLELHKNLDEYVKNSIKREPAYTTWKIREQGEECYTIDYVFYTKEQLRIKNCLEFPQANEIGINRTPSFQYPSDHFSLVCDFELLDEEQQEQKQQESKEAKQEE